MLGTIVNQSDIYMYFESIKQMEPKSVLDIGMFLKRIGAVSRQVMEREMDESIALDGVDFMPELQANVYQSIYHAQGTMEQFVQKITEGESPFGMEHYDVVFLLRTEPYLDAALEQKLWQWLKAHATYAITDYNSDERAGWLERYGKLRTIAVNNERYGLILFG